MVLLSKEIINPGLLQPAIALLYGLIKLMGLFYLPTKTHNTRFRDKIRLFLHEKHNYTRASSERDWTLQ